MQGRNGKNELDFQSLKLQIREYVLKIDVLCLQHRTEEGHAVHLPEALNTGVQGASVMTLLQEDGLQKASFFSKMCQWEDHTKPEEAENEIVLRK